MDALLEDKLGNTFKRKQIMTIRKARRSAVRAVIALYGPSGAGKTFTALQLGWGLAGGNSDEMGMLDTENGRGEMYDDCLVGTDGKVHEFWYDRLDPPFTPQRFIDKRNEFNQRKLKVLVEDTISHEWNGSGGVLEQVKKERASITGWRKWKPEHRKFVDSMLHSDMHHIVCLRSTNKTDWTDPQKPVSKGLMPVQQDEFLFEVTISIELAAGGKSRYIHKCPAALEHIFGKQGEWVDGYITPRHGIELKKWIEGGKPVNQQIESARNHMRTETDKGSKAVIAIFEAFSQDVKALFSNQIPNDILESAKAYDEMQKQPTDDINSDLDGE